MDNLEELKTELTKALDAYMGGWDSHSHIFIDELLNIFASKLPKEQVSDEPDGRLYKGAFYPKSARFTEKEMANSQPIYFHPASDAVEFNEWLLRRMYGIPNTSPAPLAISDLYELFLKEKKK